MLKIHNSLTGVREEFRPLRANQVRMYVCGITVYDYIHLGHARMLTVFDLVQRYLRLRGYNVTYVRNITDIEDKIIQRAADHGEDWRALAERFTVAMHEDCARLGLQRPDHEPRATEYIPEMIAMIQTLIDKGYAYAADGDVLYSVRKFPGYGRLSGKRIDDLRAGSRVQIDDAKHDPLDFVLWKRAKPGEPSWDSPWGAGRPGWHIECSAMSVSLLGMPFDLHGGGMDLKFPHHENEIAQSCAACDAPFVQVWMHNGFVRINDEKMSKSLGNFFTMREVLKTLRDPEVLRLFLLSSHYRGPINYSEAQLAQADETLLGLYRALDGLGAVPGAVRHRGDAAAHGVPAEGAPADGAPAGGGLAEVVPAEGGPAGGVPAEGVPADAAPSALGRDDLWARFTAAMDDDFNTPDALAVMQGVARELNIAKAAGMSESAAALAATLRGMGQVLGVLQQPPQVYLQRGTGTASLSDAEIEALLSTRRAARAAKNFAESDRIRDVLATAGIMLEDKAGGATGWSRVAPPSAAGNK
jgi:cysteinyl-tRNA synthetase